MGESYDVAVIGASISGATAAGFLGREGIRVALIERDQFPRRKACGEGVSDIALAALSRLGLGEELSSVEGTPFYSYRIDLNGRRFAFASAQRQRLKGVGIQRYHLDCLLAEHAAKQPSVTSFFDVAVSGLERQGGGFLIGLNNGQSLRARRLVLADGANSPNATRLHIPKQVKGKALWGISFLLEGHYHLPVGEVVVILKDGFEINCTPVGSRHLNVAFLAEKERVLPLQDATWRSALLQEAMEKSGFSGAPVGKPLQIGPVGSIRRSYLHDSVYLIGDAAESLDPIAGMGMTHGILTAECAAHALVSDLRGGIPQAVAAETYVREAIRLARPYRGFTQLTASLLRSPLRGLLLPALSFARLPEMVRSSLDARRSSDPALAFACHLFLALLGA
jgi:2-polyprenyl-6-methoxyphenol hydroxylase-like FAD-dependent oxidoreductase